MSLIYYLTPSLMTQNSIRTLKMYCAEKNGVSRSELITNTKLSTGGRLTERKKNLTATGFLEEFTPWHQSKGEYYKLIDEFTLFYLEWIEKHTGKFPAYYWIDQCQSPRYHAWAGYAFEAVCLKHINIIVDALGIKRATAIGHGVIIHRKDLKKRELKSIL